MWINRMFKQSRTCQWKRKQGNAWKPQKGMLSDAKRGCYSSHDAPLFQAKKDSGLPSPSIYPEDVDKTLTHAQIDSANTINGTGSISARESCELPRREQGQKRSSGSHVNSARAPATASASKRNACRETMKGAVRAGQASAGCCVREGERKESSKESKRPKTMGLLSVVGPPLTASFVCMHAAMRVRVSRYPSLSSPHVVSNRLPKQRSSFKMWTLQEAKAPAWGAFRTGRARPGWARNRLYSHASDAPNKSYLTPRRDRQRIKVGKSSEKILKLLHFR